MDIIIKTLDSVDIQNPRSNFSEDIKLTTIKIALAIITIKGKFFFMRSDFSNCLLLKHLTQTSAATLQY